MIMCFCTANVWTALTNKFANQWTMLEGISDYFFLFFTVLLWLNVFNVKSMLGKISTEANFTSIILTTLDTNVTMFS